ncbi:ABC transporter ATP-binding protein [Marinoscillum sp.]|uniref:ABC transporter ATP-binding protein n=1 Tax=Marinoscillum sp. TaxID=2024838 RepID=UPI003BAB183D
MMWERNESGINGGALPEVLGIIWNCSKSWTFYRMLLSIVNGILPLGTLYLIKKIVDEIVLLADGLGQDDFPYESFVVYIGLWLGLILVTALLGLLLDYISEVHNHILSNHMQGMIQEKALAVEYRFYDTDNYHDIFHRAQREASSRPQRLLNDLTTFISSGASLIILSTIFLSLHWAIGLAFVLIAIPTALVQFKFIRKFHEYKLKTTQLERKANYLNQLITFKPYAKENRIYAIGPEVRRLFIKAKDELLAGNLRILNTYLKSNIGTVFIEILFLGGIFYYVIVQTGSGILSIGSMVMYFQAFQRGQKSMKDVLSALNKILEQKLFLKHLLEFLHLKGVQPDADPSKVKIESIAKIEIKDVGFSYLNDSFEVLKHINLTLNTGEILAIVGENGSGKSSLVKLLCGFHSPSAGEILIDGKNINDIDNDSYWNQVSTLFQDYSKYHLSAGFNVSLREGHWDEKLLREGTDKAGATEVIDALPHGFKTQLGKEFKGSSELSGGQYQRLALSRALYKSASVLILDEPTSFIDGNSERIFLQQLREISRDRIVIMISHKLSNIILADKICVLHEGHKVEFGSHDELIKANSYYKKMFEPQLVRFSENS